MKNHPKDRHVLAAAVSRGINIVITRNLADFPQVSMEPYLIEAQMPDEFVRHVIDLAPEIFLGYYRERNEVRRTWAIKNGKQPHSDVQIAEQLAITADPPMPETSKHLLDLLSR